MLIPIGAIVENRWLDFLPFLDNSIPGVWATKQTSQMHLKYKGKPQNTKREETQNLTRVAQVHLFQMNSSFQTPPNISSYHGVGEIQVYSSSAHQPQPGSGRVPI